MKNFINDSWEKFNQAANDKNIYLFGVNGAVKLLKDMEKFGRPWNIAAIIDNDENKHGEIYVNDNCYQVYKPAELIADMRDGIVLICGTYTREIATQLESMNVQNYFAEFWMNRSEELKKDIVPQRINDEKIEVVKSYLADMESRHILDSVVEKRKSGEIDYTDIMYRGPSEYFIKDFWTPFKDGVYIDGGAYDGDTIEEIAYWTKGNFKRIYSFEPQADLAERIQDKILWKYGDRVKFQNKGLWSSVKTLAFENGDDKVSGRIDENALNKISTCVIDNTINEKVSFIKMDIEGAEFEALKGAEKTIKRDKPCMAICIYHKPSDLWEIPILIHEMVPEYEFFIKHCSASMYGTILYVSVISESQ